MIPAIIAIFIIIVAVAAAFSKKTERERTFRLTEVARELDLEYQTSSAGEREGFLRAFMPNLENQHILRRFSAFWPIGHGASEDVQDLIVGRRTNLDWYCFTYKYVVSTGKSTSTLYYTMVCARSPLVFKHLTIRPENFGDKMAALVGVHDIQFESAEFNKSYFIQSENRKFAYDVLCPELIKYLLEIRPRHFELDSFYVVCAEQGRMDPDTLGATMEDIEGFLKRIPDYVRQDIGFVPSWRSPLD